MPNIGLYSDAIKVLNLQQVISDLGTQAKIMVDETRNNLPLLLK